MQLPELQKQLVEKIIQPFYVFVGEEMGIMDIYMQKIAEVVGADLKRVDSLKDIFAGLRANSFPCQTDSSCFNKSLSSLIT